MYYLRWLMLMLFANFITGSDSLAENSDFQIYLWDKVTQDTKKDSETEDLNTNHTEAKIAYHPKDSAFHLGVEVDHYYNRNSIDSNFVTDIRPYETYFEAQNENQSLRIGYQIVRWGKTDEVSPFDIVTAEDFRDGFVRTRSERKLGTPMIQYNRYIGSSTLEFLVKPIFQADKYDFSDSDWSLLGNSRGKQEPYVDVQSPGIAIENTSLGGRYSFQTAGVDLSLDMYSGLSGTPVVSRMMSQQAIGPPSFNASYERVNFIGAESSTEVGSYMLRADVMYSFNEMMVNYQQKKSRADFVKYVVGTERLFDSDLYVNLQYGQVIRARSTEDSNQLFKDIQGIFAFLKYPVITEELILGLRTYVNPQDFSSNYNPHVILHDRGSWNLEFGADMFNGTFALFSQRVVDNNQGYIILNMRM